MSMEGLRSLGLRKMPSFQNKAAYGRRSQKPEFRIQNGDGDGDGDGDGGYAACGSQDVSG